LYKFSLKEGSHEEEIHRTADRICATTDGTGDAGHRSGPEDGSIYRWKKKYSGLGVAEIRRLRQLEEENRKLKQLVADLSLDKAMLQDVLRKKV
jgi:putative transposase